MCSAQARLAIYNLSGLKCDPFQWVNRQRLQSNMNRAREAQEFTEALIEMQILSRENPNVWETAGVGGKH